MFKKADRKEARERRHLRVRKKVFGTQKDQDYLYIEVKRTYMLK